MQQFGKPVKEVCHNCHLEITAWQDEKGMTKYQCPRCGAVSVSKPISRRQIQITVIAPKGQVIMRD